MYLSAQVLSCMYTCTLIYTITPIHTQQYCTVLTNLTIAKVTSLLLDILMAVVCVCVFIMRLGVLLDMFYAIGMMIPDSVSNYVTYVQIGHFGDDAFL